MRGSGKVEVGGKRCFVGNKGRRGGKGVAKREAAASAIKTVWRYVLLKTVWIHLTGKWDTFKKCDRPIYF